MGWLLIGGFIALATGVRSFGSLKGLSYTLWIFTAVVVSMFYPQYLTQIGNFKLSRLITPLLQLIMFGMGSQMSFNDFTGIIRMPKGVIIGVIAQFSIMPLIALAIAGIFGFPPEIAAGIILIGCVPSGLAPMSCPSLPVQMYLWQLPYRQLPRYFLPWSPRCLWRRFFRWYRWWE